MSDIDSAGLASEGADLWATYRRILVRDGVARALASATGRRPARLRTRLFAYPAGGHAVLSDRQPWPASFALRVAILTTVARAWRPDMPNDLQRHTFDASIALASGAGNGVDLRPQP